MIPRTKRRITSFKRRQWTPQEDELLRTLPAPVAAKLIGVAHATAFKRRKLLTDSLHRIFERPKS